MRYTKKKSREGMEIMINTNIDVAKQNTVLSRTVSSVVSGSDSIIGSKVAQLVTTLILGSVLIFLVGFAPMDLAHNAAHDSRHSHAFPCH